MINRAAKFTIIFIAVLAAFTYAGDAATSPADESDDLARLVAAAAAPKVNICHSMGNGAFNLLNINERGLRGHARHAEDIYPVPEEGCPGGVCATIINVSITGGFPMPTVSWDDTVNSTASYVVEGFSTSTGWSPISAIVYHEGDGSYEVMFFTSFSITSYRVVASCGEISDEVS